MKRWRAEILTVLFISIAVITTAYLTSALPSLRDIKIRYLLAAGVAYSIGLSLFSMGWVLLLHLQHFELLPTDNLNFARPKPTLVSSRISGWSRPFAVSLSSLFGILTPLSLGTDILRTLYGVKYLDLSPSKTAAASVRARTMKIQVTLLLMLPALPTAICQKNLFFPILFSGLTLIGVLVLLCFAGNRKVEKLAVCLKIKNVSNQINILDHTIKIKERLIIYAAFAAQIAFECFAVSLLLPSIGTHLGMRTVFALFVLLYFLSRAPTPQGIGVIEGTGFLVLVSLDVPAAQAGAFLILWDFIRIICPLILAGLSYASLRGSSAVKKSTSGREGHGGLRYPNFVIPVSNR